MAIIAAFILAGWLTLGLLGFGWGIGGVVLMLSFAIYRLSPMAMELSAIPLTTLQVVALLFSILYMAYAEGYKGFHRSFSPRVVARARYLRNNASLVKIILAPLFCMGYIYATRKRMILSFSLTLMIIFFIIVVRLLPQPWRGIVDAGVVTGLLLGIASIVYFLIQSQIRPDLLTVSPDVPGATSTEQ